MLYPPHHPLQRQNEAAGQGGEWLSVPAACLNPYSPSKLFFCRAGVLPKTRVASGRCPLEMFWEIVREISWE